MSGESEPKRDAPAERAQTAELRAPVSPLRYLLTAGAASLILFGILGSKWLQARVLLPFASAQQSLAEWALGVEKLRVVVASSCTGADVLALCLGSILAFPAPARKRLVGMVLGFALVSAVNTVRIGTLSLVVGRAELFRALHVYWWPALLILFVCAYVYLWMRWASAGTAAAEAGGDSTAPTSLAVPVRFAVWTAILVVAFVAASPWYLDSRWLHEVARWSAVSGGAILAVMTDRVAVAGNVLRTAHGAFAVTPNCMASPLIPLYLAAAAVLPRRLSRRVALLLAAPAVFFAVGTARLLVLAVPSTLVGPHSIAIHAFTQLLFGALLVGMAALWTARRGSAAHAAWPSLWISALGGGAVAVLVLGGPWTAAVRRLAEAFQSLFGHGGHGFLDEQGAAAMLPAYQLALVVALAIALWEKGAPRWRRLALGAGILLALQIVIFVVMGELWTHARWVPHVREVRAWAALGPILVGAWLRREELAAALARPRVASSLSEAG